MTVSDDEDEIFSNYLESEVLSVDQEEEENEPKSKRLRTESDKGENLSSGKSDSDSIELKNNSKIVPRRIDSGILSKVPPELFPHILKFLSSEDLVSCSLVSRFMNHAASDESLWRRLYCMRWGLVRSTKFRESAWKKLYIQRDEEDLIELVRNCQPEFKEYYVQMQAAKRSQAPLPSQVKDDRMLLDKTIADQVSMWKNRHGLADKVCGDHTCSGETCSYHQIGDVFVCEKTGHVHVCDDTCREVILDPANELLVCTISGHCFDRLLSPSEIEMDPFQEQEQEQQQCGGADEAEPFMGSGRFARAYLLGYNCEDEKELEAALRFC